MKKYLFASLLLPVALISNTSFAQHFISVSTGTQFALALRSDSTLWGWGFNENGELGDGDTAIATSPVQVATGNKWINIAAGAFHAAAIAADSTLWGWGDNVVYELGIGTSSTIIDTPTQINNSNHWRSVSAGYANCAAIRADGTLWVSGYNYYGELGTGDTTTHTGLVQVGSENDWKAISVGGFHMVAIKNDSTLWGWGYDGDGELGLDTTYRYMMPTQIGNAHNWLAVSAGFEYTLVLKADGTIWSCGFNGNGQLGRTTTLLFDSVLTQIGTDTNWKSITAGSAFCLAIKQDGTLWGWGGNLAGNLGTVGSSDVPVPTQTGVDSNWQYISASEGALSGSFVVGFFSAGFKTGGNSICIAGDNAAAELGNGTIGGTQDYFDCSLLSTAVPNISLKTQEVLIYPNPANDVLYIDNITTPTTYRMSNIMGSVIMRGDLQEGSNTMNISTLPEGVYLLEMNSNGQKVINKIVKE